MTPANFADARDMLALLLALDAGDNETVNLIQRHGDHWQMLLYALGSLNIELTSQGDDAATYARHMIARTVEDEANQ